MQSFFFWLTSALALGALLGSVLPLASLRLSSACSS